MLNCYESRVTSSHNRHVTLILLLSQGGDNTYDYFSAGVTTAYYMCIYIYGNCLVNLKETQACLLGVAAALAYSKLNFGCLREPKARYDRVAYYDEEHARARVSPFVLVHFPLTSPSCPSPSCLISPPNNTHATHSNALPPPLRNRLTLGRRSLHQLHLNTLHSNCC